MVILTAVSRASFKGHADFHVVEHKLYIPHNTSIKAFYDFYILIDGTWIEVAETAQEIETALYKGTND